MPWKIEKRKSQFCVVKEKDGSTEACHDTEEKAEAHRRALYANEKASAWEAKMAAVLQAVFKHQP